MTVERDRFAAIMALVDELLELPAAERAAALARAPVADDVRSGAKDILDADARAGDFLVEPLVRRSRAGSTAGPFRLLSLLGRGGMGEVWLAERASADFEQRVAVKLLPAVADDAAVERFRRERQILARLEHPRIAKLVDGGVTPDGQPWLAMELVDGVNLLEHAARAGLDVEGRVRLFVEVCDAVQFAHQNLVVHRDLKPSNVLVTRAGEPKLLDFGIAKLLEDDRALTRTDERPMTLDYAAPEQVRGEPVTTASDVWSLGVLLHEMLTGARPYASTTGGRGEVERAILAATPQRPSASVPPSDPKLRRRLKGDLDAIVLKAMRRDPKDRYASAEALAADLRRHLDHAPVAARGGARGYVVRATLRQHRVAVAVSALVLASLAGGLATTLWQARRAREEARRAERAQEFLVSMLRAFDPSQAGGKPITQRDILESGEARIAELGDQPEVQARLLRTLAETWYGLGEIDRALGPAERALAMEQQLAPESIDAVDATIVLGDVEFERGDYAGSARLFDAARAIAEKNEGPEGVDVARALNELAGSERRLVAYADAERHRRRALAIDRRRLGDDDTTTIGVTNDLAVLLGDEGRFAESADLQRRACEGLARVRGENQPDTLRCWSNLARDLVPLGRASEAEAMLADVLRRQRATFGDDWNDLGDTLRWRGVALDALGRGAESVATFEESRALLERRRGPDHVAIAAVLADEARALVHAGRFDEAEAAARRAVAIAAARVGEHHATTGRGRLALGLALAGRGRKDEAASELERAATILDETLGPQHPDAALAASSVATVRNRP